MIIIIATSFLAESSESIVYLQGQAYSVLAAAFWPDCLRQSGRLLEREGCRRV